MKWNLWHLPAREQTARRRSEMDVSNEVEEEAERPEGLRIIYVPIKLNDKIYVV